MEKYITASPLDIVYHNGGSFYFGQVSPLHNIDTLPCSISRFAIAKCDSQPAVPPVQNSTPKRIAPITNGAGKNDGNRCRAHDKHQSASEPSPANARTKNAPHNQAAPKMRPEVPALHVVIAFHKLKYNSSGNSPAPTSRLIENLRSSSFEPFPYLKVVQNEIRDHHCNNYNHNAKDNLRQRIWLRVFGLFLRLRILVLDLKVVLHS